MKTEPAVVDPAKIKTETKDADMKDALDVSTQHAETAADTKTADTADTSIAVAPVVNNQDNANAEQAVIEGMLAVPANAQSIQPNNENTANATEPAVEVTPAVPETNQSVQFSSESTKPEAQSHEPTKTLILAEIIERVKVHQDLSDHCTGDSDHDGDQTMTREEKHLNACDDLAYELLGALNEDDFTLDMAEACSHPLIRAN